MLWSIPCTGLCFLCFCYIDWGLWFVLVNYKWYGQKHRKVDMNSPNTQSLLWWSWRTHVEMAEQEDQSSLDHWITAWRIVVLESCPNLQWSVHEWNISVCWHEPLSFGVANGLSWLEQARCSKTLSWIFMNYYCPVPETLKWLWCSLVWLSLLHGNQYILLLEIPRNLAG